MEYALTAEPMTWANARTYAQSRGGDLATMVLAEEFLWEQFKPESGTAHYWVGAEQGSHPACEPALCWSWVSGEAIWPTDPLWGDWGPAGQPDDGGEGQCDPMYAPQYCLGYDVAEYVVDADGVQYDDGLDDQEGTAEQYAIIERSIGAGCVPALDVAYSFARVYAWQFRYDTPRARYMRRMLDPTTLEPASTEWSDYDGDEVVGDFTIVGDWPNEEAQQQRLYFGGVAHVDVDENNNWTDAGFYHDNHIGSTEVLSGPSGDVTRRIVYTAFGEPANLWPGAPEGAAQTRYLYAGAWGYESDAALPFLHVGYRWYDPETGRFLQRDPVGTRSSLNAYAYVENSPTRWSDPHGLYTWAAAWEDLKDVAGVITGIGSGIFLLEGGDAVPGANIVACGGVVWGVASAGDLVRRHHPHRSRPAPVKIGVPRFYGRGFGMPGHPDPVLGGSNPDPLFNQRHDIWVYP